MDAERLGRELREPDGRHPRRRGRIARAAPAAATFVALPLTFPEAKDALRTLRKGSGGA